MSYLDSPYFSYLEHEESPSQHLPNMSPSCPVCAKCLTPTPPPGTCWPQINIAGTCLSPVTPCTTFIIILPCAPSLLTS